ncbi:MAG: hypothetical protein MJ154_02825 [Candidatus Saccharibacteria bacterium]|nr:hypothetical protein [Candidatus Saccharibacteria bacterium]
MQERRSNRLRTILISVIIVSILAIIGTIIYNALKSSKLTIVVTPIDSEISINSEKRNNGTYSMFPGEVTVKVERGGLDAKELKVKLKPNETTVVHVYLTKNGKFDYYEGSKADYSLLKLIGDEKVEDYLKEMEKKVSIKEVLPLSKYSSSTKPSPTNGMLSRETLIKDGTDDEQCGRVICLILIDNTGDTKVAESLLAAHGYNLSDYKIIRK